jgi:hypothetical protein
MQCCFDMMNAIHREPQREGILPSNPVFLCLFTSIAEFRLSTYSIPNSIGFSRETYLGWSDFEGFLLKDYVSFAKTSVRIVLFNLRLTFQLVLQPSVVADHISVYKRSEGLSDSH